MTLLGSDALEGTSRLTPTCLANPPLGRVLNTCSADSLGITSAWHTALIGGVAPTVDTGSEETGATESNSSGGVDTIMIIVFCVAGLILVGFFLVAFACYQSRETDSLKTLQAKADDDFEKSVQRIAWGGVADDSGIAETSFGAGVSTHAHPQRATNNAAFSAPGASPTAAPPATEIDPNYSYDGMPGGKLTRKLSFNVGSLEEYSKEQTAAITGSPTDVDNSDHVWSTAL